MTSEAEVKAPGRGAGAAGIGPPAQPSPNGRGGGRPGPYRFKDLTSGSIPRNLWFLAWPLSVEGVLRVVDQIADLIWAGVFGHRAIAGMGVAQQYNQVAFTARMGMDVGMRAMVSRAIGMGDVDLANRVVLQAATLTLGYGVVMILVGIFLTEGLLHLIGVSEGVIELGARYMQVQFVGQAAIGFQNLTGHALAAAGDTMTPMKATLVSRIIHLALSPLLMFGLLGLPELGLPGAAAATIIAHVASLGLLLYVLFRGTSRLHLRLRGYRPDWVLLRQLIKIGTPAAINGMERSLAQLFLLALVTPFGDYAVAAFTLTRRVEMFGHMGSQGFGQAAGILVGQNLGSGQPERAKRTIIWAAGIVLVFNTLLAGLMYAFPELFLSLFSRESEFLEVAKAWLLIQLVGYGAMGLGNVAAQSFQTAGATVVVMLVTLATMWGIEFPLAYFLSRHTELGALGIAWAMVSPMLARPLFFIPYFLSGHWARIRVFARTDAISKGP